MQPGKPRIIREQLEKMIGRRDGSDVLLVADAFGVNQGLVQLEERLAKLSQPLAKISRVIQGFHREHQVPRLLPAQKAIHGSWELNFCSDDPEADLEEQERVMIVAAEGVGKTMLARQVAICCAAGVHPFTYSAMPPVNPAHSRSL